MPDIKIEIKDIFTCGEAKTCVANIHVVVNAETTLNVCDVFEFDDDGLVVSIIAYKV